MTISVDILDRRPEEAARVVTRQLLDAALRQADRLSNPDDLAALHDFRVALRRLRTWIRAFRAELGGVDREQREAFRRAQAATGPSRDAEVRCEWLRTQSTGLADESAALEVIRVLEARWGEETRRAGKQADLARRFRRAARALAKSIARVDFSLTADDRTRPPVFAQTLAEALAGIGGELATDLEALVASPDKETCHRARIRAKRLRYLVEPFAASLPRCADLATSLRGLQVLLGEWHDAEGIREQLEAEGHGGSRKPRLAKTGLRQLIDRADAAVRTVAGRFRDSWWPNARDELQSALAAVRAELHGLAHPGRRGERRLLLDTLPRLPATATVREIHDGWLPGSRFVERVRAVREAGGRKSWFRSLEGSAGGGLGPCEEACDEELFLALWPLTTACRIRRRRHRAVEGDRVWVIDEFLDRPLILAILESGAPGGDLELPVWLRGHLVRELGDEPGWSDLEIARRQDGPAAHQAAEI